MNKDTTEKILSELEKMITEGVFTNELETEIMELIRKINSREESLYNYRRAHSKDKYREELLEAIAKANQRLQE